MNDLSTPRMTLFALSLLAAGVGCGSSSTEGGNHAADGAAPDDAAPMDGGPDDFACRSEGDGRTSLVFVNRCSAPVQVRGSDISDTTLAPDAHECVDIGTATELLSAKRYWGFTGNDPGGGHHTLAEFTFNTDFNDFDWYNISHVDAHNLTMQIVALDRPNCEALTCDDQTLLTDCPPEGRVMDGGELVACVSPERDNPDSPVALHFESCDDGYAWSGDDAHGDDPSPVRACAGEDWLVGFCP